VGNNLDILNQEITKLKIYKDDDLIITDEDIVNLTNENIEANLFLLIDSIVNKDKKRAICIYHEMIKMNEEPIAIIISLANKMRGLYQTKELFSKGYKDVDIATILGVKPGYLYYMKDSLKKYDSNTLLKLLKKLADLDYNIKKGSVNKELGLELFILEN
jgi:DNA polymerase-3 subunit delta